MKLGIIETDEKDGLFKGIERIAFYIIIEF
jgi:hypothetical protein